MDLTASGGLIPEDDGTYSLQFVDGIQYTCDWTLTACVELDASEFGNPFGPFMVPGLALNETLEDILPGAKVKQSPGRTIVGIEGQCFAIQYGEDGRLNSEVCFSSDAVWLYARTESEGRSSTMEAVKLRTEVNAADLRLPFEVVHPDEVPEMGERGFFGSTQTEIGEVPPVPLSEAFTAIEHGRAVDLWISTNDVDFYEYAFAGQTRVWRVVGNVVRIRSADEDADRPILSESGDTIGLDEEALEELIAKAEARGVTVVDDRDWVP
jgi:hypothetical protein